MNKLIFFTLLSITNGAIAQLSVSSQLSSFYTDNLYRSPQKTNDLVSSFDINITYENSKWPLSLSFFPEYDSYLNHSEQNFWLGAFNIDYSTFLDKNNTWQIYGSFNGIGRLNRFDYTLYNYLQYQLLFAVYHENSFALHQISYYYQVRNYSQFKVLSNSTHYLNWILNKSFKTRTSVITTFAFASRNYNSQNGFMVIQDTLFNKKNKRGHHKHAPRIITRVIPFDAKPVSLNQLSLSIRVAQNVLPNLGFFIQYLRSFDFFSSGTFQNFGSYLGDDQLFDDPLSYLNNEWSAQMTWLWAKNWQLKLKTNYNKKNYLNEKAFLSATDSIASGDLRKDKKWDFLLTLNRTVQIKKNLTLDAGLQIFYIDNQSNSYWFCYQNFIGGLIIKLVY